MHIATETDPSHSSPLPNDPSESTGSLLDPTLGRELLRRRAEGLAPGQAEQVLQLVPVAITVLDAAGWMVFCNRRAAELLGGESTRNGGWEKFRGGHRVLRPDGTAWVSEASPLSAALREGRSCRDLEARVIRPDGSLFLASVSIDPIREADGRPSGAIHVYHDITRRKGTEQKLRAREAELELIRTHAPVMLSHWDTEHRLIFASRAFAARWHSSPEALVGKTVPEILGPSAFDTLRPFVGRVLGGETVEFEAVVPYQDIGLRFVHAAYAPEIGDDGRVRGYLAAVTDMTERWQAENALEESEARLRLATRAGKIGLWDWDVTANRVVCSESLFQILGLEPTQFEGTFEAFIARIHDDDRGPVHRALRSALEHDSPCELEFRALRPGGAAVWLFTSAVVVREDDRPVRVVGASLDITARKSAELGLRESEKRFRALASHAPVGIFLTNPDGDTIFVNEAWCRMVGVPPPQARGRGWVNAIHPDDRARVAADWESAVRRGVASQAEYRFLRPDGTVTWVQGHAVQLLDDSGRRAGYLGTIADVTERRSAEERLRANEAQLRLISTNAPIILAHCDAAQRFLFVNRAYAERFSLRPEDILGRTIPEVLGPAAHQAIAPHIARVLAGESVNCELEIPYASIGRRIMRVAYVPDLAEDGAVRGWLSAMSDVTEESRAQDAVRRLAAIVESSEDAIISKDLDGTITSWNKGAERIFGYSAEEALGQSVLLLIPEDRRDEEPAIIDRVRSGNRLHHLETVRRRKDGTLIDISLTISPLKDAAGVAVGASIIARDITAQKKAEAELHAAQEQLEAHAIELEGKVEQRTASLREAIAQMEEFSYSVSHDLRGPLRAMNAYAQALVEDYGGQLDATALGYLERIQRSSTRMEKLTHDVLTYSRVARADVRLTALDLETIVRDVVAQYAELQSPAADVVIATPLAPVVGHESSLGQCLANLLMNAAKFVAPGVRPRIEVRTERRGDRVRIWIVDNGIGIAPEFQAGLFRVFERVPTRQAYAGTGIGLAIVRKAAEKMGGRCGVESDGRQGSRFWIELASP